MATLGGAGKIQFFFVNGIRTNDESESQITTKLQEIVKAASKFKEGEVFITCHPNASALTERIITNSLAMAVGLIATAYSIKKECEDEGSVTSRVGGAVGVGTFAAGCIDAKQMRNEAADVALKLAAQVKKFLDENNLNIANVILHCQGAAIGYWALEELTDFKDRIRVITLGPMLAIPQSMASSVHNYQLSTDIVSKTATVVFGALSQIAGGEIIPLTTEKTFAHSARDYFDREEIQMAIQTLANKQVAGDMTERVAGTTPYYYTYGAGSEHNRRITFWRIPGSPETIKAKVEGKIPEGYKVISTVSGEDIDVELFSSTEKMKQLIRQRDKKEPPPEENKKPLKDIPESDQDKILSNLQDQGPWRVEVTNDIGKDPRFEEIVHLTLFNPS